jgi:hypothetical protein
LWIQRCCASMRAIAPGWLRNVLIFSRERPCASLRRNSGGLPRAPKPPFEGTAFGTADGAAFLTAHHANPHDASRIPVAAPPGPEPGSSRNFKVLRRANSLDAPCGPALPWSAPNTISTGVSFLQLPAPLPRPYARFRGLSAFEEWCDALPLVRRGNGRDGRCAGQRAGGL